MFARKANIGVVVASGAKLNKGDTVTLIKNSAGFAGEGYRKAAMNGVTLKGGQGVPLEYDFELSDTPTTIDATVVNGNSKNGDSGTGTRVREETKSMVEARAAAVGIANAGADLVAGQAMHNALSGTSAAQRGMSAGDGADGVAIAPFFALTGATQRLESGSYVDVHGVAAVLGLAARKNFNAVALTGGLFFVYGTSRFNTPNSFDAGDVDGTGRASYTGGGLLARIDLTDRCYPVALTRGCVFGAARFGACRIWGCLTGEAASRSPLISISTLRSRLGRKSIWGRRLPPREGTAF